VATGFSHGAAAARQGSQTATVTLKTMMDIQRRDKIFIPPPFSCSPLCGRPGRIRFQQILSKTIFLLKILKMNLPAASCKIS
jgi:hypothetical protein